MKTGDYLFQDLKTRKKIKASIGQADYYPNLISVPDSYHIIVPPSRSILIICRIMKGQSDID
jgi:hypothetical protein